MNKIINFIKEQKKYFFWGAIGALSFILIVILFSALGIYYFKMNENFFVRGVARVFPYPVARVNWNFIFTTEYQKDINTLVRFYKFEAERSGLPVPGYEEISTSVLDRLVRNRAVEKIARDLQIKITGDELEERFLEMTSKMGSPEDVEQILKDMYGWGEREFKKNIVKNMLLQERITERLGAGGNLDTKIEEELEKAMIKIYIK